MKIRYFQYIFLLILLTSCATPTPARPSEPPNGVFQTDTPLSIIPTATPTITGTPTIVLTTPPTFWGKVNQPSLCHNGPNENYIGAIIISADTEIEILATNSDSGDWFMIRGSTIDTCWIKANSLILSPQFDPNKILLFKTVLTIENTSCYISPRRNSKIQTVIPKNWRVVAYGKSDSNAIWVLVVPHDSTQTCWIEKDLLPDFDYTSLPIEVADSPTQIIAYSDPTRTPRNNTGGNKATPTNNSGPSPTNTSIIFPSSTPTIPNPNTPVPSNTPISPTLTLPPPPTPTPTLCWPPGHCK